MADNQVLFETIVRGLSNLKSTQDDLIEELQGFEDQYSKDYKIVNDRLDAINVQIDKTIREAVAAIPKPKDGQDFNEEIANELITKQIDELIAQKDKSFDDIQKELLSIITKAVDNIPTPTNGENGLDGRNGLDGKKGQDGVDGQDGANGERGAKGNAGDDATGEDGIGIKDVYKDSLTTNNIVVEFTDGTKKTIELPYVERVVKSHRVVGANDTALIVPVTSSLQLEPRSQTILCDATAGVINITLPEPSICINSERSYIIGITKTDLTTNKVNILPFASEKILNDASQYLVISEVVNLVTDGVDWWYRS